MRLAVYDDFKLGLVVDSSVADMQGAIAAYLISSGEGKPEAAAAAMVGHELGAFIRGGAEALATAKKVEDHVKKNPGLKGINGEKVIYKMGEVKLRPPVTQDYRFKAMCIGANFADHLLGIRNEGTIENAIKHAHEENMWGFYKLGSYIVGTGEDVPYPKSTQHLDYEGEVGLIVSKPGKDVKRSNLLDYVFGFTHVNDFSIRDDLVKKWPDKPVTGGLQYGKNFDGGGAMGPIVVLKDELPDPHNIDINTKVNGEVRQKGNTKDMIRNFGEWLEFLTIDRTVRPGDIISSGTCAGTAADTTPRDANRKFTSTARFLKPGDEVEVYSNQIGSLKNRIV